MFTWICPQCGREVPPAYTECPDCAKKAAEAAGVTPPAPVTGVTPPVVTPAPVSPQPSAEQPVSAPPPNPMAAPQFYPPPQYQQPPAPPAQPATPPGYYLPPQAKARSGMPVWLMTIVFALGVAGAVFGVVSLMSVNKGTSVTGPAPGATPAANTPSPVVKPPVQSNNQLQKYIEVSGVRFIEDEKKNPLVKFVVINHSPADLTGLAGNVTVWAGPKKSDQDVQGVFSFTTNIGPSESKDLTAPFDTKLKIYELADWQNIATDVQITAPNQ